MSNWEERRFEEIVEVNPITKLKKGNEYAFIDIDKVSPILRTVSNVETKTYDGQSCSKFCKGDTVFSRITPCLENRKIAQVDIATDAGFGSTEFYVFRARENEADKRFVYYLGSSDAIVLPAINSMTGASGRQRADKRFIERLKITVPDLPTQKRIVDVLSAYDDLIENNSKRIALLEKAAQELYKEWFVRFRFPGYEKAKFVNGLPEGWNYVKLGEYANISTGKVEMAVIISEDADETAKFAKQGLDISIHRAKMNEINSDGKDIEDRFKDENDPLQLVFVCAMWLTGFDVPNLSTLYLDKPMKGHTLMQAIARANRVYHNKSCGIIVDYVNVFKYMKKALTEYATGNDGTEYPAKDIDQLIGYIDATIVEADEFLLAQEINLGKIIEDSTTFDKLDDLRTAYDTIIANDENKEKFKVILNTLTNLYEASKPEIFEKDWHNEKFPPLVYLHGLFHHTIDDEKVNRARIKMAQILDGSVSANNSSDDNQGEYLITESKVIDLSKIDVEKLREEIKVAQFKAIEIDDLKTYIDEALKKMLNKNCTRTKFSERYKRIIDSYNAGGTENEDYYEQLVKLIEDMKKENERADVEGLTEEELEIFDLLIAGKKLTKAEEQMVKLSAKNLFKKLSEQKEELLVVDWYKDEQPFAKVKSAVEVSLNDDLPDSYDRISFTSKIDLLMNHFVDMAVQGYGWIGEVA